MQPSVRSKLLTRAVTRRQALQAAGIGLGVTSMSGWLDVLAAEAAAQPGRRQRACILLWMQGGPSHIDSFDPKPESPHAGEFKPIDTAIPGVQFTELLPRLAKGAGKLAVLRGMSTGEGSHERATYLMHTGYKMGQPFAYPGLGSIAAKEIGDPAVELPSFVSVGAVRQGGSPGYLGPAYAPLVVANPERGIENLRAASGGESFEKQWRILELLESRFRKSHALPEPAVGHQTAYEKAAALMKSRDVEAFDLSKEAPEALAAYGASTFGKACLLARRLVEAGVPFVEVPFGGWDTHRDNFKRLRGHLSIVDQAMSALLGDLDARGLLESTLVIWMGEFGRTPKVNQNAGRDHYAKAWTTVFAGAGVPGGQCVGRTDKLGAEVIDRPIAVPDFLATVCRLLDIDYSKTYTSNRGRPIRIVDKGEKLIDEVLPAGGGRRRRARREMAF